MHRWHQRTGLDAPRVGNEFMKALACQWYGTGSKCVSAGKMRQVGPEIAGRNCAAHGVAIDAGGVLEDRAPFSDAKALRGQAAAGAQPSGEVRTASAHTRAAASWHVAVPQYCAHCPR